MEYCVSCGSKFNPNSIFCSECGEISKNPNLKHRQNNKVQYTRNKHFDPWDRKTMLFRISILLIWLIAFTGLLGGIFLILGLGSVFLGIQFLFVGSIEFWIVTRLSNYHNWARRIQVTGLLAFIIYQLSQILRGNQTNIFMFLGASLIIYTLVLQDKTRMQFRRKNQKNT